MSVEEIEKKIITPLVHTTKLFYVFLAVLLIGVALWLYAWYIQLTNGLVVTGMRDVGTMAGATWGLYISNFIFFIAISHAGIAISASVRIARLKRYTPITRMAELLTVFGLIMAMLMVISDLGRPDRIFNMILYYPERVGQSPLAWDFTAVLTYFTLSTTYLYITLRPDIALLLKKSRVSGFREKLYRLLLPFYKEGEEEKIERVAFWMAISIVPVMVFVHSTVSWIFGLMVSRPGWYSTIFAPYFVVGAIANGVSSVILVSIISRELFKWEDIIGEDIIRGMANMLGIVTIIYLYFWLSEILTTRFGGLAAEFSVVENLFLHLGPYTLGFWLLLTLGLLIPFLYLFAQAVDRRLFKIKYVFIAAFLIDASLWVKRVIIVVPSLLVGSASLLPYLPGVYIPTWVEWTIVSATFVLMALLYLVFVKLFPLVPIHETLEVGEVG